MTPIDLDTSTKIENAEGTAISFTRADIGALGLLITSVVGLFWRVLFTSELFFYRDVSASGSV